MTIRSVRAKFVCTAVDGSEQEATVRFEAVTADGFDGENTEWSKWTPSGSMEMHVMNPAVLPYFEVGKEYYLDITKV